MGISRIVGLDLGTKTLGVAVSDPLRFSAQGVETIRFSKDHYKKAIELLENLLAKYEVELFILGNPKHMNGDEGESSKRSYRFKERLEAHFSIPVVLWDERLSTSVMIKSMIDMDMSRQKRKDNIDMMAAINILQGYLDSVK